MLCVSGLCHQDAVHITAILGESVVFNCHVEFPGEHPVPYVLQWEKKVGDKVRFRTTPSALYIRELSTWAPLDAALGVCVLGIDDRVVSRHLLFPNETNLRVAQPISTMGQAENSTKVITILRVSF